MRAVQQFFQQFSLSNNLGAPKKSTFKAYR